ncbi:hypothetical protein Pelo_19367 [Pelomyxa schiedti]|nr:hypothetical protein Pelo_19367 [Pelomyxa schiedti]
MLFQNPQDSDALLWSDICDSVVPDEQLKVVFGLQLVYPECKTTLPSTFGAQFSQDIAVALAISSDSVYVNSITLRGITPRRKSYSQWRTWLQMKTVFFTKEMSQKMWIPILW